MKESRFSAELRKDIKEILSLSTKYVPHIYLIQDASRSGKKPYDFYFTHDKFFYAVEAKIEKGQSLNFKMVLDHQIDALLSCIASGKYKRGFVIVRLVHLKYNKQALIIPIKKWCKLLKKYSDKQKSIKIDFLLQNHSDWFKMVNRKRFDEYNGTFWDVNEIINYYKKDRV